MHCSFCHRPIEGLPTSNRLGGPFFCSNLHSAAYFRGEDYSPPIPDINPIPPFFRRPLGPRLSDVAFRHQPECVRLVGMLGH